MAISFLARAIISLAEFYGTILIWLDLPKLGAYEYTHLKDRLLWYVKRVQEI